MEDSHKELRQEMIDVCLESLHEGLFTGTSGNLSVALGDGTILTSYAHTIHPNAIFRQKPHRSCH